MGQGTTREWTSKPQALLLLLESRVWRGSLPGAETPFPSLGTWLMWALGFVLFSGYKQGQSDLLLPHSPDGPAAPQRRVLCHRGAPRALLRSAPPGHQTLPQGSEGEVSSQHGAGTPLNRTVLSFLICNVEVTEATSQGC